MTKNTQNNSWEERFENEYGSFQLCDIVNQKDHDRLKSFIQKTRQEAIEEEKARVARWADNPVDLYNDFEERVPDDFIYETEPLAFERGYNQALQDLISFIKEI